jgi:hypothetical protein
MLLTHVDAGVGPLIAIRYPTLRMHVHDGQLFGLHGVDETGRCVDQKLTRELRAHRYIGFGAPTAKTISVRGNEPDRSRTRHQARGCSDRSDRQRASSTNPWWLESSMSTGTEWSPTERFASGSAPLAHYAPRCNKAVPRSRPSKPPAHHTVEVPPTKTPIRLD